MNIPRSSVGTTLWHDFSASLVVFLVALPLCMGIAIASGVPVAAGLLTGIIGGIIVGTLTGSPLQVSGPAAGLSVLMFGIVTDPTLGLVMLGVIVLGAGAIQLTAGALGLGQWFRAVSPAVVEGMLAGIGLLLIASQIHVMVDDEPRGDGLDNLLSIPEAIQKGVVPSESATHTEAASIGLLTIAIIVLWKLFAPKRLKVIPAPLTAIVVATLVTIGLQQSGVWPQLRPVIMPESLLGEIRWPTVETLLRLTEGPVLVAVFTVAFIASAETLLCATAVQQLRAGARVNYDQELMAQGVGNILCGMVSALPMTGVIVRSSTNVAAGAQTRLSAILHGAWLLLLVLLLPGLLGRIPKAALAAVLVYTGYKLVNVAAIRRLWAYGASEVLIYTATVVGIVAQDLLFGVVLGILLSMAKLVYTFSHLEIRLTEDPERGRTNLDLHGAATFIRLPRLAAALERVPPATELHVHFEHLAYIDHACLNLLMNWEKQHHAQGGSLVIDWDSLTARVHGPSFLPRAVEAGGPAGKPGTPARQEEAAV